MNLPNKKEYDVFLSHNGADKSTVEIIACHLEEKGLNPFLDKWHLVPGEPWQEALEQALDKSNTCVVFLGPSGLGPWENEEMRSALAERVRERSFRVIPVLLPGTNPDSSRILPRFLKRLTWVDFRNGLDNPEALERLVSGIQGVAPRHGAVISKATLADLQRGIIHALPPAPAFVGRKKELSELQRFWLSDEETNVLSLIGLGGAGKTALAAQFLASLLKNQASTLDGLFVWSFYVDQDVNNFLRVAYHYFSAGETTTATGSGMLYFVTELLAKGGRNLIIIDGLERVQRPSSDLRGAFGEFEDPLLKQVISRLTFGVGQTKCIITSRFPVSDLQPWDGKYYRSLKIDQLEIDDARSLLRNHGVKGNDHSLDLVISEFGSHALTLDHLGIYLAEFCDGNPLKANQLEDPRIDSDIREERKLARVLYAYESSLSEKELGLLMRFCIFRFGITTEALYNLFSKESETDTNIAGVLAGLQKSEFQRLVSRLTKLHLILQEPSDNYSAHPAVRDHFYRLFTNSTTIHGAVGKVFKNMLAIDARSDWEIIANDFRYYWFDNLNESEKEIGEPIREKRMQLSDRLEHFLGEYNETLPSSVIERLTNCIKALQSGLPVEGLPLLNELGNTTLSERPGGILPENSGTLSLLEEVIYHSIKAKNITEANIIYNHRLGGRNHLGKRLGEYARGIRILKSFPECPNVIDLAWYYRGVGDLESAYNILQEKHPIWSGPIVCLQGYLPRVIENNIGWPATQDVARFLVGQSTNIYSHNLGWGEALIGADLYLLKGDFNSARTLSEQGTGVISGGDIPETIRSNLVLAETERASGNLFLAEKYIDTAAPWILRSSSVEHLCFLHLIRTRLMMDKKQFENADSESKEGLYLSRNCGFGLYHIDMLNERGKFLFTWSKQKKDNGYIFEAKSMLEESETCVLSALNGVLKQTGNPAPHAKTPVEDLIAMGAKHPECQYKWGMAASFFLLGEIMIEKKHFRQAKDFLEEGLEIQLHLEHPDVQRTKDLLQTVSSIDD